MGDSIVLRLFTVLYGSRVYAGRWFGMGFPRLFLGGLSVGRRCGFWGGEGGREGLPKVL